MEKYRWKALETDFTFQFTPFKTRKSLIRFLISEYFSSKVRSRNDFSAGGYVLGLQDDLELLIVFEKLKIRFWRLSAHLVSSFRGPGVLAKA